MVIAKANGATPPRCRQTSFGWASDCPSAATRSASGGCGRVPREPAALELTSALAYVRAPCIARNRGRAVALLSWSARLRPCVRVQACSLATAAVPPFAEPWARASATPGAAGSELVRRRLHAPHRGGEDEKKTYHCGAHGGLRHNVDASRRGAGLLVL